MVAHTVFGCSAGRNPALSADDPIVRAHPGGLLRSEKRLSYRSAYDEWLWQEMAVRGMPIRYGAPNAAAHIERLIAHLHETETNFAGGTPQNDDLTAVVLKWRRPED